MGNKRFFKGQSISDSLTEFYLHGISGGSGEHKLYSSEGFADDELDYPWPKAERPPPAPKVCSRCNNILDIASNYCRECYETRVQWMPPRPTRKLRKLEHSLVSSDEELKEPPLKKYSILRRIKLAKLLKKDCTSSDECGDISFVAERKKERLKRRQYIKKQAEKAQEDSSSRSSTDDESMCLVCEIRQADAILVHDKTAHLCVCVKCAASLERNNEKCPTCGKKIHYYFTGYTDLNKHS